MAAVAFGLAHPLTRLYVVGAAVLGAYLGCCFALTGNLLVPVVTHAAYDFLVLVVLVHCGRGKVVAEDAATHTDAATRTGDAPCNSMAP